MLFYVVICADLHSQMKNVATLFTFSFIVSFNAHRSLKYK